MKEQRIREQSRQSHIAGEKKSLAKKAATNYEQQIAEEEIAKRTLQEHASRVSKKDISSVFIKSNLEKVEKEVEGNRDENREVVKLRKTK